MTESTGLDILAFWRAIEYLTPATPEDATMKTRGLPARRSDLPGTWNVRDPADPPWLEPLKPAYAGSEKEIWRFKVTIGFAAVDDAMDELREVLGHLPDDEERPGAGREMAVASIVVGPGGYLHVSATGRPAVAVAPLPWAMGLLRAKRHPTDITDFEAANGFAADTIARIGRRLGVEIETDGEGEDEEDEEDEGEIGGDPGPVTIATLEGLRDLVTSAAAWSPRGDFDLLARITAVPVTCGKMGFPDTEPALLGSFIARDLTRVRAALEAGNIGTALRRYLFGREAGETASDVVRDPAAALPLLSPALIPAARWPSPPEQTLVLAQQLAVNAAFDRLRDRPGLFSVNGPPGTGKTTLLRDLVAAVILERARVLAGFTFPEDAFPEKIELGEKRLDAWTLAPELRGFEMVVASSNNGAVENVTTELPGLKAVDPAWTDAPGFFPGVARTLLEDEPGADGQPPRERQCWALLSAVLGNRANRRRFVDRFWWADPAQKPQQPKHWASFKTALKRLGDAPPDWGAARRAFQASLEEVERLRGLALDLQAALADLPAAEARLTAWEELEREIANHLALRPGWLDLVLRLGRWVAWLRAGAALKRRLDDQTRALIADGGRASGHRLADVGSRLDSARRLAEAARAKADALRTALACNAVPDAAFFTRPVDERERAAPWSWPAFEEARKRCFLAALYLHRAFLAGAASRVRANLGLMMDVLAGKPISAEAHPDLWATLFLAVPVVSTTFASFPRLFEGMGRESLGWLLVDEAGQAPPQHAAGALWRARRAVVIGDPRQIEPVVPLPDSAIEALRRSFKLDDLWHPTRHSAQVLADRANTLGGHIGETWVGCPLRVHRRCYREPMFEVANRIAYDGLMVYGGMPRREMPLGPSRWIDEDGPPADDGHFIPSQGTIALDLIRQAEAAGALKELYVISPFRSVALDLRGLARGANLPAEWVRTGIGTVHTFQGKEADMVILLLGGNPARPGAFRWAAEKPNLLNVALTRARQRVYVIGNRDLWCRKRYFETLGELIRE